MFHYIKVDKDGNALEWFSKESALEGYETQASAGGTQPYLVPASLVSPAFDARTQVRTGPVIDVGAATITYTVRNKTQGELDAEAGAETDRIADQISDRGILRAYILCINDGSIVPGSNMRGAALKAAIKAKL